MKPVTAYGQLAELVMGAVRGSRVVAYGQAFGGAHSNPRPTTWTADVTDQGGTFVEHEQSFTMFGGEDAISVNAEAATASTAVLVGGWDGPGGRYGAASWTSPDGVTWTRHADADGLSSAVGEQTAASGVTSTGSGFVALGSTMRGDAGGLVVVPLAWLSQDGVGWRRVALPASGPARADVAGCDGSGCVVVGGTQTASQHLLCWTLSPSGRPGAGASGPGSGLVQPGSVLLRRGEAYVLHQVDHVSRLATVSRDCTRWAPVSLPVKTQDAALGLVGDRLLLVSTESARSRIWLRNQPQEGG
ncbi:hypothetical protein [Luteipulveratus mongoliensis]|uniref:Exo-alpha-sialidase n=1 Tax=Luteipulveratus mongoliensis TaxID=571913 RepID=A0A0K1JEQ1_9MICO|nr:hypothetical protein [Luteipulveratus mongoliensis]AKU15181.1 hypothetical protein VV02_03750 [Luteipulveratus mongoliensis]